MDTLFFYGYELVSAFIPWSLAFMVLKRIKPYDTKEQKAGGTILLTIFIIYLVGVYHYTGAGTVFEGIRYGLNKTNEYNLVPFVSEIDVVEHLLNVILFVPFGLLMPFMYDKKSNFYQIIILGVGLSLLIEISQLLNHRVTDIDDLLLNSIGVVLGYGVFILLNRCIKSINSLNAISLTLICTLILSTFLGRFLLYNEMGLARMIYNF